MKGSRHGFRSLFNGSGTPLNGSICSSCRNHLLQARQASTAAAVASTSSQDASQHAAAPEAPSPKLAYQIRAGVVLSRPPQITRDLTPFEKAFYIYQRRLNERLALPAMQYFYFRPNSPAMIEFKRKRKMRKGVAARDIGTYNPYDKNEGWNDELLMGDQISEPDHQANELIKDSMPLPRENEEGGEDGAAVVPGQDPVQLLMPRSTEADEKGDERSLSRLLQRTLYLLVQNGKGQWTFPEDVLVGKESLALAAERILTQSGGVNMNTWVVGNHPVGHRVMDYKKLKATEEEPATKEESRNTELLGEKLFFMKARIMAGQANLKDNKSGFKDFKWLAREELEKQMERPYWNSVKNMLPAR